MSEFALRFATDELERANREAENKRLAWLVARAARPAEVDIEAMEAYCEAANYAAQAQSAFDAAQIDAQNEWATRWGQHGNSSTGADPSPGGLHQSGSAPVGESLEPRAVDPRAVRFPEIRFFARED